MEPTSGEHTAGEQLPFGEPQASRAAPAVASTTTPEAFDAAHGGLSAQLTTIVEAAEHSAAQLREQTEQRARERIAEAERAADYRMGAAEEEAAEILEAARIEAKRLAAEAASAVRGIHTQAAAHLREAEAQLEGARQQAQEHLANARAEADKRSREVIDRARDQAREIVGGAHVVTREVIADGSELSTHLTELSQSLRANAERLLSDIRLVHGSMTARLDQALPEGARRAPFEKARPSHPTPPVTDDSRSDDFGVPEFITRRPSR